MTEVKYGEIQAIPVNDEIKELGEWFIENFGFEWRWVTPTILNNGDYYDKIDVAAIYEKVRLLIERKQNA